MDSPQELKKVIFSQIPSWMYPQISERITIKILSLISPDYILPNTTYYMQIFLGLVHKLIPPEIILRIHKSIQGFFQNFLQRFFGILPEISSFLFVHASKELFRNYLRG